MTVKCDNLKAYMDDETGFVGRFLMLAHIKCCAGCRRNATEWADLASQIKGLTPEPVPSSLAARLNTDASAAAAQVRAHQSMDYGDSFRLKKAVLAAGFTVVLLMISVNSLGFASIL